MKELEKPRRSFIKAMLAAGVAPLVAPSRILGAEAPSNRVTLGFIGLGGHGLNGNLRNFLRHEDCRALAVCDAYRDRTEEAKAVVEEHYGAGGCRMEDDFRAIIDDPTLDAVVISTPDHWHVPMSLMALAAGKHVFCEKPTLCIDEGRDLVNAVRRSGKVFQTGLEDRSLTHYHRMVEWVRNGDIGDLYHVDVVLPPGQIHPGEEPAPVPEGLDWNLWLGPAPFHPYTPTRAAAMHWRYIRDYSTGVLTDWGTHLVDTAQLAVDDPQVTPVEVKAWGKPPPEGAQSDIPAEYEVHYRYGSGITMTVRNAVDEERLGSKASIRCLGSRGWVGIQGWRGVFEASDPDILRRRYNPESSKHFPLPPREHRNFLDGIRSGVEVTYPAQVLHDLSTTLHMGLIAMDLQRPLKWDPKRERFMGDTEANERKGRTFREDWKRV